MLLIGCALIGVARRYGDAFDIQLGRHIVEKAGDGRRLGTAEQGAVDVDAEALFARSLDRLHGTVEHALLADRLVVLFPKPVEVNREGQIGRRLRSEEHTSELQSLMRISYAVI